MNETMPIIKTDIPGPKSAGLLEIYDRYIPAGVSRVTGIFAEEAKGALIKDVDGNVFLDFAAGIGVVSVGHCPDEVVAAITEQAGKYIHTSSNIVPYEGYIRVAERLCSLAPVPNAKCMLVNSGAEAVENAIKISRKYTKRSGIVTVEGSFHGRTLLTLGMTSKIKPYKHGFGPFEGSIYQIPCPDLYRNNTGLPDDEYALLCANEFEKMLNTSLTPDMVACVIIEPIQGEGGFIPMPKVFLKRIQELCSANGIVFIMDEIQTGVARTGTMYASEQLGIKPDILTTAKAIAGGLPLSAVVGRGEIMDSVQVGGIGGTYSGNPVACAAALAVLDNVVKYDLCGKAKKLGEYIKKRCLEMQGKYECIKDVRGLGAMIGMELTDKETVNRIISGVLQRGVIFLSAGMYSNVIRFLPPLVMTEEQAQFGMDSLEAVIGDHYG